MFFDSKTECFKQDGVYNSVLNILSISRPSKPFDSIINKRISVTNSPYFP